MTTQSEVQSTAPHVLLNETSPIWRDPVEVLDVEDSKAFDFAYGFFANRRFRLVKAVQCKIP